MPALAIIILISLLNRNSSCQCSFLTCGRASRRLYGYFVLETSAEQILTPEIGRMFSYWRCVWQLNKVCACLSVCDCISLYQAKLGGKLSGQFIAIPFNCIGFLKAG